MYLHANAKLGLAGRVVIVYSGQSRLSTMPSLYRQRANDGHADTG